MKLLMMLILQEYVLQKLLNMTISYYVSARKKRVAVRQVDR